MTEFEAARETNLGVSYSRLLGALAVSVLLATGVGAKAAGFDCRKAASKTEKLICADPALSALDSDLKRDFDRIESETAGHDADTGKTIDPNGRDELQWLRTVRAPCADAACLKRVYTARLASLRKRYPDILTDADPVAGTYERTNQRAGGGSFVLEPHGAGWRVSADIGGIPDGAATHADCRFEAEGALSGQAFHGTVLPDPEDKPDPSAKPRPVFDFSLKGGRVVVRDANSLVLCDDDRVIIDGVYAKPR